MCCEFDSVLRWRVDWRLQGNYSRHSVSHYIHYSGMFDAGVHRGGARAAGQRQAAGHRHGEAVLERAGCAQRQPPLLGDNYIPHARRRS